MADHRVSPLRDPRASWLLSPVAVAYRLEFLTEHSGTVTLNMPLDYLMKLGQEIDRVLTSSGQVAPWP